MAREYRERSTRLSAAALPSLKTLENAGWSSFHRYKVARPIPRISATSISVMPRSQHLRATTANLGLYNVLRPPPRLPRPRVLPYGAPRFFSFGNVFADSSIEISLARRP